MPFRPFIFFVPYSLFACVLMTQTGKKEGLNSIKNR
jgi:hypothetical protein